jgi:hypothetical protein
MRHQLVAGSVMPDQVVLEQQVRTAQTEAPHRQEGKGVLVLLAEDLEHLRVAVVAL